MTEEARYSKPPNRPKSEWEKLYDMRDMEEVKAWEPEPIPDKVDIERERQMAVKLGWSWKF